MVEADISNFQKETQGGTFEIEWECCVLLMLSVDVGGGRSLEGSLHCGRMAQGVWKANGSPASRKGEIECVREMEWCCFCLL